MNRPVGSWQALAHGTSSLAEVSERDWHVSSEDRLWRAAVCQPEQNVVDVGRRDPLGDVGARGTYVVKTATKGMVLVLGGRFRMGSGDFYPEERPIHEVVVRDLWVDEHLVTNAQFRRFVKATGHVTLAEQAPDAADFPGAAAADLVPGSLVFVGSKGPIPLDDWTRWWAWVPGTNWRHPYGPGSTLDGRDLHPVVHVGYEDAAAYAVWIGKALPTESQWEYAARGGLDGAIYVWGAEFMPKGRIMANTWHGRFPWENLRTHGFDRTSPVRRFAPNGYGLYDVAGNVWEWTTTPWVADHTTTGDAPIHGCCTPRTENVGEQDRRVIKGGSHLCAPSYCHRYRPAARQGHAVRSTTSHLGFRCVIPA
jgi:sulfatase modifying factor 1